MAIQAGKVVIYMPGVPDIPVSGSVAQPNTAPLRGSRKKDAFRWRFLFVI